MGQVVPTPLSDSRALGALRQQTLYRCQMGERFDEDRP